MIKIISVLALAFAVCAGYALHLRSQLEQREYELLSATSANELMREQIELTAQIDKKHAEELKNAMDENAKLAAAIAAGTKRVYVKSVCPAVTATSPAVDDARDAELNRVARQDYLHLREQLAVAQAKISGLQDYVSKVCLAGSQL